MSHYRSQRNRQFLNVEQMNTQHILNAISKVRSGTHFYYNSDDNVLVTLLMQLEVRNAKRMVELEEKLAVEKKLNYQLMYKNIKTRVEEVTPVLSYSRLEDLRTIALEVARDKGLVTADTLRSAYAEKTRNFWTHGRVDVGPYLPYVFRDKRFKKIGFLRSTFPANNGRFINVWTHTAAV